MSVNIKDNGSRSLNRAVQTETRTNSGIETEAGVRADSHSASNKSPTVHSSRRKVGNPVILAIDLVSILIGLYGFYTSVFVIKLPPHLAQAGHGQFLTNLSLVYSLVVFAIGFLAHLTASQTLFKLKNNLHPIGLALETIVAGVYWPLRLFFLHLLTKEPSKFNFPLLTDLSVHLMPIVSLLIDYLVFMPKWTIENNTALSFIVAFMVFYWFLLKNLVDTANGASYPYEFLDVGTDLYRVGVFGVVGMVAFSQFLFMKKVYDVVVGSTEDAQEEIDKKLQ